MTPNRSKEWLETETTCPEWTIDLDRLLWSYHENGRPDGKTGVIGNPKTIKEFVIKLIQSLLSQQRAELIERVEGMKKNIKDESNMDVAKKRPIMGEAPALGYNQALSDVLQLLKGEK